MDAVAALIRRTFGGKLSPDETAALMYQIVVYEAVQGAQTKTASRDAIAGRCREILRLYGSRGTDFPGLIKPQ